jgi:hypothetical protein
VVAVSTPTYGTTLDASVEEILNYAVANMDALGVDGLLELVAVLRTAPRLRRVARSPAPSPGVPRRRREGVLSRASCAQ